MTSRLDTSSESGERAGPRFCDHPGCQEPGLHRAPKSRSALRDYFWFCLDHVREYNLSWNYYSGMSEKEVERERRGDTVWHRPTWPFSSRQQRDQIRDPFGLFGDGAEHGPASSPMPPTPEEQAMAALELSPPISLDSLKRRYKELVKRHHPDANGGDRAAEEKLKSINHAYDLLIQTVTF